MKYIRIQSVLYLLLTGVILFLPDAVRAQYKTSLTVTDCQDPLLAQKIDQNGSQLLTAFNMAFFNKTTPSLNFGGISNKDKEAMLTIWEMTPFRCLETELIERVLKSSTGYQVRNIPIYLEGVPEEDAERDIVINFDRQGNIYDIYFALEGQDPNAILQSDDNEVTDLRERMVLLEFVENYRTAHNRRDIGFISQIFSNDALIITGRVLESRKSEMDQFLSKPQIEYQTKTKDEYITNLKRVFNNNKRIDIKFEEIQVMRHPKYDGVYGVTLKQYWNTTGYKDVGYVFLSIDFREENRPLIKVRTWQPTEYQGRKIDPGKIFDLGDFPME